MKIILELKNDERVEIHGVYGWEYLDKSNMFVFYKEKEFQQVAREEIVNMYFIE